MNTTFGLRQTNIYVALEHVEGWTGRIKKLELDIPSNNQLKCFDSGDVLFGKLRPYLAKVTRPLTNGYCSSEFLVLRSRTPMISTDYMEYLLRSKPVIDAVNSSTFGAKMPRTDWNFVGCMAVVHPSLPEQASIVRFLGYIDQRIQRQIHTKKKLITLLGEQKRAIIQKAVTGQIDVRTGQPYPAYKPSGVEWLGDVPEHWELQRADHRLSVLKRSVDPSEMFGRDVLHFSIPNVQQYGGGIVEPGASIDSSKLLIDRTMLLVSKLNPRMGTIALAQPSTDYLTVASGEFISMEPKHCIGKFSQYLYESENVRCELSSRVDSATKSHQRCSPEDISKLVLSWPPLPEQTAIVCFLDEATTEIDQGIVRTHRQIDLLREYRTRLIADVVTGKLDVREAAAQLPGEDGREQLEEDGTFSDNLDENDHADGDAAEDPEMTDEMTA